MNKYLAFPVTVDLEKKSITSKNHRAVVVDAQNAESALLEASRRIPLIFGERIAVVLFLKAPA